MAAVINCYDGDGLLLRCNVQYVTTYRGGGLGRQLRVYSRALYETYHALKGGHVALVHVHSASRGSFWRKSVICSLARAFKVPYIFHLHSGEFPDFFAQKCGGVGKLWVRWILRGAATTIALTDKWRAALEQIEPAACIDVVANPIAVPAQLPPLHTGPRTVLFLGRLQSKKGVFDLVRAIPKVLDEVPTAKFVLAGDGEIEAIRALASELGVADVVLTPGWIDGDDKRQVLSTSAVFVLPSYFEGLPMGILEAMASGVPVVATHVGGIPDAAEHDKTALLVSPGDIDGLARQIVRILLSEELSTRLRANAFSNAILRFSRDRVCSQLESIYLRLGAQCSDSSGAPAGGAPGP